MVMLVFQAVGVMQVAHIMTKEFMDGLQNLVWEHSEQFDYHAVWAWRFLIKILEF